MKRVVIPLTLILFIVALGHVLSVVGDINEKANDGDIEGVVEEVIEEIEKEAEKKVKEPFWILLIKQPLVWILGAIGTIIGVKFVIR